MSDSSVSDSQDVPVLESVEQVSGSGGLESNAQALLYLLRIYTLNHRSARVDKLEFINFVKTYAGRYTLKYPQMELFVERTEGMVDTYLRMLMERGLCTLEKEGQEVRWIFFPQYFIEILHKAYKSMGAKPELPFPSEEDLKISIPDHLITELNIKTDFVSALAEIKTGKPQVLRVTFPDLVNSLLVTSDLVERKLMELAVLKLRVYLESKSNASYVAHRLHPALRGNERGLRDMISAVMTKPGRAVGTLLEPSDFSFRFWAHFANLVLQEHRDIPEKTAEEHSYCQAAYLLGFYNVHFRGRQQKQHEKSSFLKKFEIQFHKYPYAYTLKDLYSVRDNKGVPLIRQHTKDAFLEYLEAKTKSEGYESLPELVQLKTVHGKQYYIHKDLLIPLFVKMLYEQAKEIRDVYVEEWVKLLKENRRTLAMTEEQEFARDVDITLKNRAPFLYSLLNYNLLYLAKEQGKINYDMARTMDQVLDEKKGQLQPLPKILGLSRKEIFDDAKLRVPIWRRLTIFRGLFYFFQNLFRGIKKALQKSRERGGTRKSGAPRTEGVRTTELTAAFAPVEDNGATTPRAAEHVGSTTLRPITSQQLAAYRKAVTTLKEHFVGSDKTIAESLNELVEKWNPLYDPQARRDLVEDVNSMVRDYLRNIRRSFRIAPPDADRIRSLADKLAASKSFSRIKRKDYFTRYIEIYMIKLLGES
ncbi:MAG: hypothetical protein JSV89_09675 [Spirochaetaceae bacterium]|nr:MAG: hypothetical protein JSV89_09675 [Spirochaetaceae bacterium]